MDQSNWFEKENRDGVPVLMRQMADPLNIKTPAPTLVFRVCQKLNNLLSKLKRSVTTKSFNDLKVDGNEKRGGSGRRQ